MKTVAQVQLLDGGTAEVVYDWNVQPDGKQIVMSVDAALSDDDDHTLCWEDQFAMLDTAWLILVDIRRAARKRRRRTQAAIAASADWHGVEAYAPRIVGGRHS